MKVRELRLPGGRVQGRTHLSVSEMFERMTADQRGRLRKVIEDDDKMNAVAKEQLLRVMSEWENDNESDD